MTRDLIKLCTVSLALLASALMLFITLCHRDRALDADARALDAEMAANHRLALALRTRADLPAPGTGSSAAPPADMSTAAPRPPNTETAALTKSAWVTHALSQMPEYATWQRSYCQRNAMREYGEWLSQLQVTPDRLREIKEFLGEYVEGRQAKFSALIEAGFDQRSPEYFERSKRDDEDLRTSLQQKLSPEEYASWKIFTKTKGWAERLPEIQLFFGERGVPPLSAEQRSAFVQAAAAGADWKPSSNIASGLESRMRAEFVAEVAGRSLPAAQRDALQAYIRYVNDRSRITGQLLNPSAPDDAAYWPSPAF